MPFTEEQIKECIEDLFIIPRRLINKWSAITNQTAQVRLAYPGQHIVSLVTGVKGIGTAARGVDLSDGSEIKSCSRADQLGKCKKCGAPVMRSVKVCPICGSDEIDIKEDSHWIFSITSEEELSTLLKAPRVLLLLIDRNNNNQIRIRIWQVNPKQHYFREFFKEYYYNNFSKKLKAAENKIAPCNLHPLKYDFYMMEPVLIFDSHINNEIPIIDFYNLNNTRADPMPANLLKRDEKEILKKKGVIIPDFLDTTILKYLKMRKKTIKKNRKIYIRKTPI